MRRMVWAISLAVVYMFWPWTTWGQERTEYDPVHVAADLRRCLDNEARLTVAPGATAALLDFNGYSFIIWPSAIFNRDRASVALDLPDDLYTEPSITIEIVVPPGESETARPTMVKVRDCGRRVVPIFP